MDIYNEDVQKVSYEVDHIRFRDLEKAAKSSYISQPAEFVTREKQAFDSAQPDKQIDIVIVTMVLRNLRLLKTQIECESKAFGSWEKWEKWMELQLLKSPLFERYEEWLVAKCAESEEYESKVLQKISESIKEIEVKNSSPYQTP